MGGDGEGGLGLSSCLLHLSGKLGDLDGPPTPRGVEGKGRAALVGVDAAPTPRSKAGFPSGRAAIPGSRRAADAGRGRAGPPGRDRGRPGPREGRRLPQEARPACAPRGVPLAPRPAHPTGAPSGLGVSPCSGLDRFPPTAVSGWIPGAASYILRSPETGLQDRLPANSPPDAPVPRPSAVEVHHPRDPRRALPTALPGLASSPSHQTRSTGSSCLPLFPTSFPKF